ncbi:MAG: 3'(2'),5'-bisphosphate nucleotidase CysQ [Eubacteriales bacterium]|nr:3'(2'),5'-bisphosphate nucleotidase CysQ [Eubacteriales bacterium]
MSRVMSPFKHHQTEMIEKIIRIAYEAGKIIMDIYNTDFNVDYKDDNSPLTKADKLANDHIVDALKIDYPNMAILAEESADDLRRLAYDYCWLVDPLDGTKEFIKRNGEFSVNIALTYKHRPVLGVIYIPVRDEVYHACQGQGAYFIEGFSLHGDVNKSIRIQVTSKTDNLIMLHSRSHQHPIIDRLIEMNKEKIGEIVHAGSSIKGCLIAKGEADIYYRFGLTMEWDTAAMQCIIEEAGGMLRQMDDTEMTYNRKDSTNHKGFYILNRLENKLTL